MTYTFTSPIAFDHMTIAGVANGVAVTCRFCGGQRVFAARSTLATICADMADHYSQNHPLVIGGRS